MRDPGLVQRAERAALALEHAWEQWRSQRGLGADKPTPVSSYVGYSLEEPWGQPRVVFGLGAEEAEILAAVLDGHDNVGPVHAGMTDWPGAAGNRLAALPAVPEFASEDRVAVPAQARAAAESGRADEPVEPEQVVESAGQPPVGQRRVAHEPADEQDGRQSQLVRRVIAAIGPRGEHDPIPSEVVALEELVPLPAAHTDGGTYDASGQGTGYRGPRYQGFPPQYQAEGEPLEAERERPDSGVRASDDSAAGFADDEPDRAGPRVASRLSWPRRSQRGGQETGASAQEQELQPTAAADSAV